MDRVTEFQDRHQEICERVKKARVNGVKVSGASYASDITFLTEELKALKEEKRQAELRLAPYIAPVAPRRVYSKDRTYEEKIELVKKWASLKDEWYIPPTDGYEGITWKQFREAQRQGDIGYEARSN